MINQTSLKNSFLLVLLATVFFACRKDKTLISPIGQEKHVNQSLVYKLPSTEKEKLLVQHLEKITAVIKDVYKNKEALKEVNAAIQAGIYSDQSILLADLIYLEEGLLSKSSRFAALKSKLGIQQGSFSTAFWESVNKAHDAEFSAFLVKLKPLHNVTTVTASVSEKRLVADQEANETLQDEISIYYPYAEQYINPYDNSGNYTPATSVMTASADADEGYGWQPVYDNSGNLNYQQVIINDEYAEINPTHVIGINGIEQVNPDLFTGVLVFPPSTPIVVPGLPRQVKQVYVGEVRCKRQYDSLISFTGNGGGSEIRFTRSDGYLKLADGHVQADNFLASGPESVSRYNIRKSNWVDWTVQWDADWESDNSEQNLAVYEEDNRNTLSLTLSLSTKVKISNAVEGTGTIGGTLSFKSDDQVIRQQNHKYDVFSALNRGYAGEATRNGWLIYDNSANVSFTLPDRTLTP